MEKESDTKSERQLCNHTHTEKEPIILCVYVLIFFLISLFFFVQPEKEHYSAATSATASLLTLGVALLTSAAAGMVGDN